MLKYLYSGSCDLLEIDRNVANMFSNVANHNEDSNEIHVDQDNKCHTSKTTRKNKSKKQQYNNNNNNNNNINNINNNKNNTNSNNNKSNNINVASFDPVTSLKTLAKIYGVKSLVKR